METSQMKNDLEARTRRFASRIIAFVSTLPKNRVGDVITYQLVKSGTSIGANYREAARAESRNDFIHKITIVEKESSESEFWLQVCDDSSLGDAEQRVWLLDEVGQLLRIFSKSGKTAKAGRIAAQKRRVTV
jgi:four helix bundle protein